MHSGVSPPEISPERLKLESSNFVCLQAMSNDSLRTADLYFAVNMCD